MDKIHDRIMFYLLVSYAEWKDERSWQDSLETLDLVRSISGYLTDEPVGQRLHQNGDIS